MKFLKTFSEVTKPADLDEEVLKANLRILYGAEPLAAYTEHYAEYKEQAYTAIDRLVSISGVAKFAELKKHFEKVISPGTTRDAQYMIKANVEVIYCKLQKLQEEGKQIPQSFIEEVQASSLSACTPGVATYMENIANSIAPSIYYKKYEFIRKIATAYLKSSGEIYHAGNEVHMVNELIYAVREEFNLEPPVDTYARYMQSYPAESIHNRFKVYLTNFMEERQAVYSYIDGQANELLNELPSLLRFPGSQDSEFIGGSNEYRKIVDIAERMGRDIEEVLKRERRADGTEVFKYVENYKELKFRAREFASSDRPESDIEKITRLASLYGISVHDILSTEDYVEYTYRPDLSGRIKAALIEKIKEDGFIEHSSFEVMQVVDERFLLRTRRAKESALATVRPQLLEQVKFTRKSRLVGGVVYETPDGWFLANSEDEDMAYKMILDTRELQGLHFQGIQIEDFIHDMYTKIPLAEEKVYRSLVARVMCEVSKIKEEVYPDRFLKYCLLASDEYEIVRAYIEEKGIDTAQIEAKELKYWKDFIVDKHKTKGFDSACRNDCLSLFNHIIDMVKIEKIDCRIMLKKLITNGSFRIIKEGLATFEKMEEFQLGFFGRDSKEENVFHFVARSSSEKMFKEVFNIFRRISKIDVTSSLTPAAQDVYFDLLKHQNLEGETPLHLIIERGNVELIVRMLDPFLKAASTPITAGADMRVKPSDLIGVQATSKIRELIFKKNKEGKTIFHVAILKNAKLVTELLERLPENFASELEKMINQERGYQARVRAESPAGIRGR